MALKIVILSGGYGKRLWPLSRKNLPKPFLQLSDGNKSMFQKTVERNSALSQDFFFVLNQIHKNHAIQDLEAVEHNLNTTWLIEKEAKNTFAAILRATFAADSDDVLLVCPSDQEIKKEEQYLECIKKANLLAKEGFITCIGIKASEAKCEYGYIEANNDSVIKFHEKPDLEKAKSYVKAGNYYWNAGIFCFSVKALKTHLKSLYPEIHQTLETKKDFEEIIDIIPNISFDYAIMEKLSDAKVVAANFEWSDLGSFQAIKEQSKESNKVLNGKAQWKNAKNNLASLKTKNLIANGIEDLCIIEEEDCLYVGKLNQSPPSPPKKFESNPLFEKKPWGYYQSFYKDSDFLVKKLVVNSGESLSLQKHFHREEHWIVVKGEATITVGEEKKIYKKGSYVFIPKEAPHRLENFAKEPLLLVEVQAGDEIREDDIVRLEDRYER